MSRQTTYIVYLVNGTKTAVKGSGSIFSVCKENNIKNTDIDFYTELSSEDYVFKGGSWVREADPKFRSTLINTTKVEDDNDDKD